MFKSYARSSLIHNPVFGAWFCSWGAKKGSHLGKENVGKVPKTEVPDDELEEDSDMLFRTVVFKRCLYGILEHELQQLFSYSLHFSYGRELVL